MQNKKLTTEETSKLDSFMGKCVRLNVQLGVLSNRVGVNTQLSVQELYNSNIPSLLTFGTKLEELSTKSGGRFSSSEPYKVGGVFNIADTMDIIELIIKEKKYTTEKATLQRQAALLESKLEGMKSEDEIKSDTMAQLKALKEQIGE